MTVQLLTLQQAADAAAVSVTTVKREIAEGNLVTTPIRTCVRIHPDDLERWLTGGGA